MIPVSMVVYWMMIFWLKQSDTCVNSGLLKQSDILIKTVSIVVYWMMIFWLKQSDTCVNSGLLNDDILKWYLEIKQSDTCVNSGLLNDDTLIKTKWYMCQCWFIEWWYFD